jgi:hypothetical protein
MKVRSRPAEEPIRADSGVEGVLVGEADQALGDADDRADEDQHPHGGGGVEQQQGGAPGELDHGTGHELAARTWAC